MKEKLKDQVTLADKEQVISFDGILEMNELVTGKELRKRVMNKYNLDENSSVSQIAKAMTAGLIEVQQGGYCMTGSMITSEIVSKLELMYRDEMEKIRAERRDKQSDEIRELVRVYFMQNCETTEINYKKTSHTWLKEISDWTGRKIEQKAIDDYIKKFAIKTREISDGVFCYGLKTKD